MSIDHATRNSTSIRRIQREQEIISDWNRQRETEFVSTNISIIHLIDKGLLYLSQLSFSWGEEKRGVTPPSLTDQIWKRWKCKTVTFLSLSLIPNTMSGWPPPGWGDSASGPADTTGNTGWEHQGTKTKFRLILIRTLITISPHYQL